MGIRDPRPDLVPNDESSTRLSRFVVRDSTVLCSPELTAYLGIFPRQLSAGTVLSDCRVSFFAYES